MSKRKKIKPRADKFYIDFSTEDGPGLLATFVMVGSEFITDKDHKFDIALAAHPLYPRLEAYVKNNPSGKTWPPVEK